MFTAVTVQGSEPTPRVLPSPQRMPLFPKAGTSRTYGQKPLCGSGVIVTCFPCRKTNFAANVLPVSSHCASTQFVLNRPVGLSMRRLTGVRSHATRVVAPVFSSQPHLRVLIFVISLKTSRSSLITAVTPVTPSHWLSDNSTSSLCSASCPKAAAAVMQHIAKTIPQRLSNMSDSKHHGGHHRTEKAPDAFRGKRRGAHMVLIVRLPDVDLHGDDPIADQRRDLVGGEMGAVFHRLGIEIHSFIEVNSDGPMARYDLDGMEVRYVEVVIDDRQVAELEAVAADDGGGPAAAVFQLDRHHAGTLTIEHRGDGVGRGKEPVPRSESEHGDEHGRREHGRIAMPDGDCVAPRQADGGKAVFLAKIIDRAFVACGSRA